MQNDGREKAQKAQKNKYIRGALKDGALQKQIGLGRDNSPP